MSFKTWYFSIWFLFLLRVSFLDTFAQKIVDEPLVDSLKLNIKASIDSLLSSSDSTKTNESISSKSKFYPVPKKALRYSLLLPGLAGGQFYNRDYWKAPIVLGAYGVSGYFIVQNLKGYNNLVDGYKKFYDLDPNSPNFGKVDQDVVNSGVDVHLVWQKRTQNLNMDQVKRMKDYYRRMRDWSFFSAVIVYALSAVEANVAAHMKTFDLTDDISMKLEPSMINSPYNYSAPGMRIVLTFK